MRSARLWTFKLISMFGFSIPDFITVAGLALTISRALRDSRGSEPEYKSLIQLLDSLATSLHKVVNVLVSSPSTSSVPLPDTALLNGLRFELDCCHNLMKNFLERSRKYTESLVLSGNSNQKRVLKEWRKISWCLFGVADAKSLENRLQSHVNAFQLYLSAISFVSQARMKGETKEILEINRRTERMLCDLYELARATAAESQIPKVLGFSWGGCTDPKHGVVNFEDVLGMRVELPIILCRDFEIFHDTLEIMFRNRPGHKRVTQREYEIGDSEGKIIWKSDWERKILLPGIQLVMIILSRKSQRLPHFLKPADIPLKCPRCDSHTPGKIEDSMTCAVCGLIFRITDLSPVVEKSTPKVIDLTWRINGVTATPSKLLQSPAAIPNIDTDATGKTIREGIQEKDVFKRIHCIRRFIEPAPQKTLYKQEIVGKSRIAGKIRRFMEKRFPKDIDILRVDHEPLTMSNSNIRYTVHAPEKLTIDFRVIPALVGQILTSLANSGSLRNENEGLVYERKSYSIY